MHGDYWFSNCVEEEEICSDLEGRVDDEKIYSNWDRILPAAFEEIEEQGVFELLMDMVVITAQDKGYIAKDIKQRYFKPLFLENYFSARIRYEDFVTATGCSLSEDQWKDVVCNYYSSCNHGLCKVNDVMCSAIIGQLDNAGLVADDD